MTTVLPSPGETFAGLRFDARRREGSCCQAAKRAAAAARRTLSRFSPTAFAASRMSIKELAGHVNLQTTQRYLHLSSRAKGQAISALDAAHEAARGDTGETDAPGIEKLNA